MITVLLTEDEDFIRNALIKQIPWSELGVGKVLQAESGEKALKILAQEAVDIVITDIQMEDVSGLDLCQYVSEHLPNTKVIIITGFGKMEYAKTAIQYSASYFVLKPIDPEELEAAIVDCVAKVRANKKKEHEIQELQEKVHREQVAFSEKFLSDMADEALVDENYIDQSIMDLSLKAEHYYCITFVSYDNNLQTPKKQREIAKIVREIKVKTFYKERILFMLYASDTPEWTETVQRLQELFQERFLVPCFWGVSQRFSNLFELAKACLEARTAANLCFIEKSQFPMSFGYCTKKYKMHNEDINSYSQKIADSIISGDKESALAQFHEFWKAVLIAETKSSQLKKLCVDFIVQLYENFAEVGFKDSQRTTIIEEISELLGSDSWEENYKYLYSLIISAVQAQKDLSNKSEHIVISKIRQYIHAHLHQTITLEELSGEVFLSPKYISALVKKNTGSTITEMITEARIEKAKEYLQDITLKTYEVAAQVGFGDPQYFSQVFKRVTGLTPKDYRNSLSS